MSIYFDTDPGTGQVRFYHEAILGPRQLPTWKSEAERKAGKRPVMIDNPASTIPADAQPITTEVFEKLMEAQASGKEITLRGSRLSARARTIDPVQHREHRRRQRDRLLAASDWTQLPDSPLDVPVRQHWSQYRTALRDLDMDASSWPTPPDAEDDDEEAE